MAQIAADRQRDRQHEFHRMQPLSSGIGLSKSIQRPDRPVPRRRRAASIAVGSHLDLEDEQHDRRGSISSNADRRRSEIICAEMANEEAGTRLVTPITAGKINSRVSGFPYRSRSMPMISNRKASDRAGTTTSSMQLRSFNENCSSEVTKRDRRTVSSVAVDRRRSAVTSLAVELGQQVGAVLGDQLDQTFFHPGTSPSVVGFGGEDRLLGRPRCLRPRRSAIERISAARSSFDFLSRTSPSLLSRSRRPCSPRRCACPAPWRRRRPR